MTDPRLSAVEMRFAVLDAELITKAHRENTAAQLAAAGTMAITATETAQAQAVPVTVTTFEL